MSNQRLEQLLEQIENNPEELSLYLEYKDLCIKSSLYEESEEAFELIIDLVNSILSLALEETGQIPTLDNGEAPYPFIAKIYYEWGLVIAKNEPENYEKQLNKFLSALEFKEDFKEVYPDLAKVYLSLSQYSQWLEIMSKINENETNNRNKTTNLYNMIKVAQNIGETDYLIEAYKEIIELDRPKQKENISSLVGLLESLDEWEELAALYEKLLSGRVTPKEKKDYTEKLLEIYAEKINNKDKVFMSLCKNFEKNPKDQALREQLEETAQNSGMQEELLSFYENIVENILDVRVRKEVYMKIGDILFLTLEEVEEAKEVYQKVLGLSANEIPAIERMVEILDREENSEEKTKLIIDYNTKLAKHYLIKEKDELKAVDAYYNILKVDPNNIIAFKSLEKVFKSKKMLDELAELYKLKVEHLESGREKAQTAFVLGELLYKHLSEKLEASQYFKIAFNEGETKALKYIENIAQEEDNFEVILEYKLASIDSIRIPKQKADTYKEIGEIYQNKLFEPEKAIESFVQSVKFNPKDKDLAVKIIDFVYENGTYDLVKDVLKELDRAVNMQKSFNIYLKLGEIAYQLDQKIEAANFYKKASDLDKGNFDSIWKLATIFEELNDNAKALRTLQFIQNKFKNIDDDVKYSLFIHLGKVASELNDRKARKFYEQAFEIYPDNLDDLAKYYKLLDKENSYEDAIKVRLDIVSLISDTQKHIELYTDIAEIYKNKLSKPKEASLYYDKIFKLGANDKEQLLTLLDRHNASKNYKASVDVLNRLISIEDDIDAKLDYKFELLNIYEKKIRDKKMTLIIYKELYKELPDEQEVILGYEDALKANFQWNDLISLYVEKIKKSNDNELKKKYWLYIANIYASQLGNIQQSIISLEQVLKITPKDNKIRAALSSLYAKGGGDPKKQLKLLRKNIKANAFKVEYYEQLFELFLKQNKIDKAYVVARILRFLKSNNPQYGSLLKKFRGKAKINFQIPLSDHDWKRIFHHRLDNQITDIFNAMSVPMTQLYSKQLKDFNLTPKEMLDLSKSRNFFTTFYEQSALFLNVNIPLVYLKQGLRGISFINNSGEISVKLGYDIFNSEKDKELLYQIGKLLTYKRPEFVLAQVIPGKVIKNIFLGVLNYVIPELNIAGDINQLNAIKKHLEMYTAPETLESIKDVVNAFIKSKGSIDLNKWLNAVEFTANRMAFILTQDLSLLEQMFKREVVGALSKADYKMKMADILNYSVSEDYFSLRKDIGLSIK